MSERQPQNQEKNVQQPEARPEASLPPRDPGSPWIEDMERQQAELAGVPLPDQPEGKIELLRREIIDMIDPIELPKPATTQAVEQVDFSLGQLKTTRRVFLKGLAYGLGALGVIAAGKGVLIGKDKVGEWKDEAQGDVDVDVIGDQERKEIIDQLTLHGAQFNEKDLSTFRMKAKVDPTRTAAAFASFPPEQGVEGSKPKLFVMLAGRPVQLGYSEFDNSKSKYSSETQSWVEEKITAASYTLVDANDPKKSRTVVRIDYYEKDDFHTGYRSDNGTLYYTSPYFDQPDTPSEALVNVLPEKAREALHPNFPAVK